MTEAKYVYIRTMESYYRNNITISPLVTRTFAPKHLRNTTEHFQNKTEYVPKANVT